MGNPAETSQELRPVDTNHTNFDDLKTATDHVEEVVIARLTEADMQKLSASSLSMWSRTGLRIIIIMFVQGCNAAGYGIDWAVIGGINAVPSWHTYLNFGTSGSTYGTLNALMTIGGLCGSPFMGLADVIGRRGINFVGNAIVIVACLLQGCAINMPMFMAGRFFMGFGTSLMSSSQYMAEISPMHLRGRIVGIMGACFQVGSLAMSGALMGLLKLDGNLSWRIPLIIQAVFPVTVCALIYLVTPETPRYLVKRGRAEEAKKVIAKYHTTSGSLDEPLIGAVISQINESLEGEKAITSPWWDFRVFATKRVGFRLLVLILYSVFQSWNGGGVISFYIVPALQTVGVTKAIDQQGINFGLTATYLIFTLCGSYIIDKFRRRTLIFSGLISIIILQTAATITSWRYSVTGSHTASILTILWIFVFQFFSSLFIATMHNLYPVEILSLVLRAKGMGLYGFIQGAAGTVQAYGISVGINKLGYKIWCVYIVYNTLQLVAAYFVFPETFGLSLEEIDVVFETPGVNPVKLSIDIQKAKQEKAKLDRETAEFGTP